MPTLISFREVWEGRDGGISLASGRVGVLTSTQWKRAFVAEFLADDSVSGPDEAVLTPGVPSIGDMYVSAAGIPDFQAFCVDVQAKPFGAPWVWMISASYTSDIDLSNPSGDPLRMPPVLSWGDKTATRPAKTYDANSNLVAQLNSAGDPIDPPITEEESWTTLKITRNFASWNPVFAATYKNCINLDAFVGFPPGEVLCVGLTSDTDYVKGVVINKVVGSFEIKHDGPDAWAIKILDRGFQGYNAAGKKTAFKDESTGRVLPGASLLDGTGKALARNATPVYRTFYTKFKKTFSLLGLV